MADAKNEALLKPGEICRRSGISRQSLYQYRLMGLIQPKLTTTTGRHLYNGNTLTRLSLIRRLLLRGYSLAEIRAIYFKDGR